MISVRNFTFERVDCPQDHVFRVTAHVVNRNNLSRTIHLPPSDTRNGFAPDLRTKDTKRDLADQFEEETADPLHVYTGAVA